MKKTLSVSLILSSLAVSTLPAIAQEAEVQAPSEDQTLISDVPRQLDQVTVRGIRGAPAPKTGRVIMNVYFQPNSGHRRIFTSRGATRNSTTQDLTTRRYGLSFARINFSEDGTARLAEASDQDRFYRMTRDADNYTSFAMNIPEGYYVLSEIRYDVRSNGASTFDPNAGLNEISESVHYCIAEKTFAFEVVNGQTNYLGAMQLKEPRTNRAHRDNLIPIVGFTQNSEFLTDKQRWDERTQTDVGSVPIRSISVKDLDLCRTTGSRPVAGWESASNDKKKNHKNG